MKPRLLDWSKYSDDVIKLESDLEALLSDQKYAHDDRRLCRIYIGLADQLSDRMDAQLAGYLQLARQYLDTQEFPSNLEGVAEKLGAMSRQAPTRGIAGSETDEEFIYRLLQACTRTKFTIHPPIDIEPLGWAAASGVTYSDIEQIVVAQYPEIRSR